MARIGGTIFVKVDGVQRSAKGSFTYNFGIPKREPVIGSDLILAGYKEAGQVAYIEGMITDQSDLDVNTLQRLDNATVTLNLANGKNVALRNAYYQHDGGITTDEGEIPIRFEGPSAEEI